MDPREEDEPERRQALRTPPPPKKSLAQFLEEFEARLRDHPGLPATDAGQALLERSDGSRRHPIESQAPERLRGRRHQGQPARPPFGVERRAAGGHQAEGAPPAGDDGGPTALRAAAIQAGAEEDAEAQVGAVAGSAADTADTGAGADEIAADTPDTDAGADETGAAAEPGAEAGEAETGEATAEPSADAGEESGEAEAGRRPRSRRNKRRRHH